MKKLFAILIALLSFASIASAQIGNVSKTEATTTILKFRAGLCSLKEHQDVYYLVLSSSNQFDSPYLVYLGLGKPSARQTAIDIYKLFNTMKNKESADFTTMGGKYAYGIYKSTGAMSFMHTDTAGVVTLGKLELDKVITALSK